MTPSAWCGLSSPRSVALPEGGLESPPYADESGAS